MQDPEVCRRQAGALELPACLSSGNFKQSRHQALSGCSSSTAGVATLCVLRHPDHVLLRHENMPAGPLSGSAAHARLPNQQPHRALVETNTSGERSANAVLITDKIASMQFRDLVYPADIQVVHLGKVAEPQDRRESDCHHKREANASGKRRLQHQCFVSTASVSLLQQQRCSRRSAIVSSVHFSDVWTCEPSALRRGSLLCFTQASRSVKVLRTITFGPVWQSAAVSS